MASYPMTRDGYNKLVIELKDLKSNQRPAVIQAIATAREHGDLKENAEYHSARDQQSFIEGRIMELENIIARATIVDISKIVSDYVLFGATVTVLNTETDEEKTYQIIGEQEAALANGQISNISPLGRALLGKEVGDSTEFITPGGTKYYEIINIAYGG